MRSGQKFCRMRPALVMPVLFFCVSLLAGAQSPSPDKGRPSSSPLSAHPYTPPTLQQRFRSYLFDSFGPPALLRAGIRAGILQAKDQPSEWGGGGQAFAERFGSVVGEEAVSGTTRFLLSSALREDDRYFRCRDCSVSQKLGNAFVSEFAARRGQDGHRAPGISQIISPFAGPLVARSAWYPASAGKGLAIQEAGFAFAARFVHNVIREFVPWQVR